MPLRFRFLPLSLIAIACNACSDTPRQEVRILEKGGKYVVTADGEDFTQLIYSDQKPFLYPVIGPTGANMTRYFPMKRNVPGESQDHPWHTSVFYAHGSVNGIDFWNERTAKHREACIELMEIEEASSIDDGKARIIAHHKWTVAGRPLLTDRTEIVFEADNRKRVIDYSIMLIASESDVMLGDTKEGCMAVRMHPKFRVKDQGASVVNSEGDSGRSVWGKPAKWITYTNEFGGQTLGISILDHPSNFRYPTTWHARDYGLCAANAFGLSYFTGDESVSGDYLLKKGEELSFSYRLIFHQGGVQEIGVDEQHTLWASN